MKNDTPAHKAMQFSFEKRLIRKGRKRATINYNIIKKIGGKFEDFPIKSLKIEIDLHNMGTKARNQKPRTR